MFRKIFIFGLFSLLVTSCVESEYYCNELSKQRIDNNVEKVFGITFDKNHDWCTTYKAVVDVKNVPSDVKKVQIIANVKDEDAESLVILNEESKNLSSNFKITFDAPKDVLNLYAISISNSGYEVREITSECVDFSSKAITRSSDNGYTLPTVEPEIGKIEDSYANIRGWIGGEKLYQMNDYSSQKMIVSDYSNEFKELFRHIVFSYFKNGRNYNNLPLAKATEHYNGKVYPVTTGKEPIVVSPIYKNDGGYDEVINSELYYYYFKESDIVGFKKEDTIAYMENLPKYKAIPFRDCVKEDDIISKHASYALIYWGDSIPKIGTKGTYKFPKGYKIGFMIRANTTAEGGKKQGELYGDGRLNNHINNYDKCNFKSSNLGEDGPRMAWLSLNGKMILCCEPGTDKDFNDIIMEIEGGIEPIIPIPDIEVNSYTFCFEDRELGDYDMNDVVIKAKRLNSTQIEYSIVACGANDKLFIKNIHGEIINDNTEIHKLFNLDGGYINTVSIEFEPIKETINVGTNFSFLDESTQPYIFDETTNRIVKLSKKGEDPHGIMIPYNFKYPKEKKCIKNAYPLFNNWGKDMIISTDWYMHPDIDFVL